MTDIREKQKENFLHLMREVEKCETEDDIDKVDELAEIMALIGLLTKKAYRAIEEAMDGRIMDLVEEGKI